MRMYLLSLYLPLGYHATAHIIDPTMNPAIPITTPHSVTLSFVPWPALGSTFCTVAVAVVALSVQLAVPHAYPLGQHPAIGPASLGHKNQPPAHVDVGNVAVFVRSVAGTTSVTPFDVMVVEDTGGQEVVIQSRPVRQQPAPAVARQA